MLTTAGRTLSTMSAKPDIGMSAAGDWAAAALSAVLDCTVLDCAESEPASAKPVPPIIKAARAAAVTAVLGFRDTQNLLRMPIISRSCVDQGPGRDDPQQGSYVHQVSGKRPA